MSDVTRRYEVDLIYHVHAGEIEWKLRVVASNGRPDGVQIAEGRATDREVAIERAKMARDRHREEIDTVGFNIETVVLDDV